MIPRPASRFLAVGPAAVALRIGPAVHRTPPVEREPAAALRAPELTLPAALRRTGAERQAECARAAGRRADGQRPPGRGPPGGSGSPAGGQCLEPSAGTGPDGWREARFRMAWMSAGGSPTDECWGARRHCWSRHRSACCSRAGRTSPGQGRRNCRSSQSSLRSRGAPGTGPDCRRPSRRVREKDRPRAAARCRRLGGVRATTVGGATNPTRHASTAANSTHTRNRRRLTTHPHSLGRPMTQSGRTIPGGASPADPFRRTQPPA